VNSRTSYHWPLAFFHPGPETGRMASLNGQLVGQAVVLSTKLDSRRRFRRQLRESHAAKSGFDSRRRVVGQLQQLEGRIRNRVRGQNEQHRRRRLQEERLQLVRELASAGSRESSSSVPPSPSSSSQVHVTPLDHTVLATFRVFACPKDLVNLDCAICVKGFQINDVVMEVPCPASHYFHKACVTPWFNKRSSKCPLCRFDLNSLAHQHRRDGTSRARPQQLSFGTILEKSRQLSDLQPQSQSA